MAKILCISDIHFSDSKSSSVYGDSPSEKLTHSLDDNPLQLLFEAIEGIGPVDLLIFCGDYIVGGDSLEKKDKAMNAFLEFLHRLEHSDKVFKTNTILAWQHILVIPGNHDINRKEEDIFDKFKEKLKNYMTPFSDNKKDQEYAPIFKFDDLKLIVACESTVDNSATINTGIKQAYTELDKLDGEECLKENIKKVLKKYELFDIPSITEETKKKFVDSCKEIEKSGKYDGYIKIMVTHHPLLDGMEMGNTVKEYKSTIGGYSFMQSAVCYGYRLFIHGHIHESSCLEIVDHNTESKTPVIQLGVPMMKINDDKCGAILVDTDVAGKKDFPFRSIFLKLDPIPRKFRQIRTMNSNENRRTVYQGDRILIDKEIRQIIEEGKIVKNGDLNNVEAASYDCALGYEYKRWNSKKSGWEEMGKEQMKPRSGEASFIEIQPNETILIYSYEMFHVPDDMLLHASPISSWERRKIHVGLSYFVDPGFEGQFCFPVTNESNGPVHIDSREPIVSVEFVKLSDVCEKNWSDRHQDKRNARLDKKD